MLVFNYTKYNSTNNIIFIANKIMKHIDIVVRVFHWCTVSTFLLLMMTGISGMNNEIHIIFGHLIMSLILSRVIWGIWGDDNSLWIRYLHSPKSLVKYLNAIFKRKNTKLQLHNPAGSYMVIAMLSLLTIMAFTGLLLESTLEFSGVLLPLTSNIETNVVLLIKNWHELIAYLMLVLIATHIAGVIYSSRIYSTNLLKMMITGGQKSTGKYE